MEPVQIAEKIQENFPDAVLSTSEYAGQISVTVKKESIVDVCRYLHDDPDIQMDLLRDVCGVDYLGKRDVRFEVVYQLYSIGQRHMIRLKAPVSEAEATIASVTSIWKGADCHERECFDMFGISFEGHPDLRRVLMPEDWEGHPLRKDYPLEGPATEEDWQGFKDVLEKAERLKEFEWNR